MLKRFIAAATIAAAATLGLAAPAMADDGFPPLPVHPTGPGPGGNPASPDRGTVTSKSSENRPFYVSCVDDEGEIYWTFVQRSDDVVDVASAKAAAC